jgi:DNA-binding NtrC family response regulator
MAYKILCVDDDPLTLRAIAHMLSGEFRVDTATSGAEAIATICANGPYAAVLSDMHMPGMDGAAFLKRAYQLAPATPRLLLTGYQDPELARRTVNEGRTLRFLTKPCSMALMNEALREAVREYEAALLGRQSKDSLQIDAVEIVSPALLAVAAAFGSVFESITADASSQCSA